MIFRSWHIDKATVSIEVPRSPVGPIFIRSWKGGREESYSRHALSSDVAWGVPPEGSAVVLPITPTTVSWPGVSAALSAGCYAIVPGGACLQGGSGLMIHTPAYVALTQIGGPVEPAGRLKYIDGCSDSLLVCPARLGEPCLNLLHLPPGTAQTAHTHPSDRIGIILRGAGVCKTAAGDAPLGPGMFWHIPTDFEHSFHTEDDSLDVFAWHPDSDFGPSHDWHPMVNRTIVDGAAANDARHSAIRTTWEE